MKPSCPWSISFRYGLPLIVLLTTAGAVRSACAQPPDTSHIGEQATVRQIVPRVLYQPTLVRLSDGTRYAGRISGLQGDSLLLLEGGLEGRIPLAGIDSLGIMGVKADSWRVGVVGAFVGAYLGTALIGAAAGQPFAYADWEDASYIPVAIGCAIPGYLLFYALGSASTNDFAFTFAGDPNHRLDEQQRLQDFVTGTPREPRFHARVFGGAINTRQQSISGAEWTVSGYVRSGHALRVNLFRGIELTLSLNDWLAVGGTITSLSEPSFQAGRWLDPGTWTGQETYSEALKGNLFAVVGSADPLRSSLPKWLRWKVQAGVGIASLTLESTFYSSNNPSDPLNPLVREDDLDGPAVGFLLGTMLELFVLDELSIGIGADYAVCPGVEFPEVPEFGLTSKPISNACLGVTLGIHL